jgi:hypothetical protein
MAEYPVSLETLQGEGGRRIPHGMFPLGDFYLITNELSVAIWRFRSIGSPLTSCRLVYHVALEMVWRKPLR